MIYCILRVLLKLYTQMSSHLHSYLGFPQIHSFFLPTILSKAELMNFVHFLGFYIRHCDHSARTLEIVDLAATNAAQKKESPNFPCQRLAKVEMLQDFELKPCSFSGGNWKKLICSRSRLTDPHFLVLLQEAS